MAGGPYQSSQFSEIDSSSHHFRVSQIETGLTAHSFVPYNIQLSLSGLELPFSRVDGLGKEEAVRVDIIVRAEDIIGALADSDRLAGWWKEYVRKNNKTGTDLEVGIPISAGVFVEKSSLAEKAE